MAESSPDRNASQGNDFAELEARLGYRFSGHENLARALTHTSLRTNANDDFHYERLEFLGDRVLALAIAHMLHETFAGASEGELSVRLNSLVRGETLAEISDEIRLHEFIRTGTGGRELRGKKMRSVRADVLEAVIASIYLDGGLQSAMDFVRRYWHSRLHQKGGARRDPKTELQEWAHAHGLPTPRYELENRTGPDHDPEFTVGVHVEGMPVCLGNGRSKREAEQMAANAAYAKVREQITGRKRN